MTRPRPARVLGAAAFAAVLVFAGSACTSSKSTSTKTTDTKTTNTTTSGTSKTKFVFRGLDSGGPLTVGALKNGSINIALLFTFSPEIAKNKWVTLEDDKHLQAADNFIPLIRTEKNTPAVTTLLNDVSAKLTQKGVFDLVTQVAVDGENPKDVAKKWLADNDLPGKHKAAGSITVGSANFAESEVVGQIYAEVLKDAGMTVTMKSDIGSRQVTMPMMTSGDLDLMPEFTASLLTFLNKDATPSNNLADVTKQLEAAVAPKKLSVLKPTNVSDVNVLVVTGATAKKYNLSKISDLSKVTEPLILGGPPECPQNAQCLPGFEKVYGLSFTVK